MALSAGSNQFISQLGVQRLVDASAGPEGPQGVVAYWLVPAGGYHNGQRFPHAFAEELEGEKFEKVSMEGVEYFLVPEESSNLPGRIAHYAQTTGVAELHNPPGGGVNRVRETLENTADHTVAPDAVSKYVDDNDSWEEARKKQSEEDDRIARQVSASPAREPAEGKLVVSEGSKDEADDKNSKTYSRSKGDTNAVKAERKSGS